LLDGSIDILVGTHAVIEDRVLFQHLGLAIIDEQHRFGVAQRAKMW
jgi:ATP-dependent DNA helicase RecG